MIIKGAALLAASPLTGMIDHKGRDHGVSHGLAEVGYDIRVRETITFTPPNVSKFAELMSGGKPLCEGRAWEAEAAFHGFVTVDGAPSLGRFCLASAIEAFQMPADLVAVIGHKSTWARRGVNVWAGTTAEPAWRGDLTLEIGFHGLAPVTIPAGAGIAQAIFHRITEPAEYAGKYQHQRGITPAILEITA